METAIALALGGYARAVEVKKRAQPKTQRRNQPLRDTVGGPGVVQWPSRPVLPSDGQLSKGEGCVFAIFAGETRRRWFELLLLSEDRRVWRLMP